MSVFRDVRLALRLLWRNPVPSTICLLSIALTVGAAAIVFAAIKAVLLEPLPYKHPQELVQLRSEYPHLEEQAHGDWVLWNDMREIVRRSRTIQSAGTYGNAVFDLAGDANSPPLALYGLRVTPSLFPTLGVSPMLGRNIQTGEDKPGHVNEMILSYGLWVRRFHSDPAIVGQTITVNGHACLVIGVMPSGFNFPMRRQAAHTPSPYVEFWAPLFVESGTNPHAGMGGVARLRPGVSLVEAQQDLNSISRALEREFPALNRDRTLRLNSLWNRTLRGAGQALLLLLGAALLFMLIGCSNVANLLLARGFGRQKEIAIRFAIGASRSHILRQMLTESAVLALLGGVGGYLLSILAWEILPALAPVSIPRLADARADGTVFGFSLMLAAINGILFGIVPALRSSAGATSHTRHDHLRSSLVIAEVALSVVLVMVGGRLLDSFARLISTNPGFETAHVLASVVLPSLERYRDPQQRAVFYHRIVDAVRSLPGIEGVGTVDALPFSGENHGGSVSLGEQKMVAEVDVIGGDYLQTMGVRLLEGRWFRDEEMNASNDAALIDQRVAVRLFANQTALGKSVCVDCTPEQPRNLKRVIGVVSSASHAALDEPDKGNVYLAAAAMQQAAFLVVRTERPTAEVERAIRRAIAALDPNQPVLLSVTMRELISDSLADRRFILTLLGLTSLLALVMSAAGVFGVVSYTTSRRTREIGIRMALGAEPGDVLSLIFRQNFLVVAIGLAAGIAAAVLSMRLLQGVLSGLELNRHAPLAFEAALVACTAAIACWIPARRATRRDPMNALRHE